MPHLPSTNCPSGTTLLPFSTANPNGYDDGNNYNNALSRFVAPQNGVYHFDVWVQYYSNGFGATSSNLIECLLQKNGFGEAISGQQFKTGDLISTYITVSWTVKMVAGDYITYSVYQLVYSPGLTASSGRMVGYRVY